MSTNIHTIAADIAGRVEAMARDSASNNAELIEGLLRPVFVDLGAVKVDRNRIGMEVRNEMLWKVTELQQRAESAENACAEMRQAMLEILCDPDGVPCFKGSNEDRDIVAHALSSDCGKDYVHRSELERERKKVERLRTALDRLAFAIGGEYREIALKVLEETK